jgi:two-component system, cell cycle response regulator DivK
MIVKDNELNMKLFHDLLEAHGYRTIGTRNGFEVLDLARKRRPDLILMDIQLPEVSGLEVTKWLKEDPELQAIPVVAVTAFAMKGDEERIREGGCEAYCRSRSRCPSSSRPSAAFSGWARVCQLLVAAAERKGGEPPKVKIAVARRILHDEEVVAQQNVAFFHNERPIRHGHSPIPASSQSGIVV